MYSLALDLDVYKLFLSALVFEKYSEKRARFELIDRENRPWPHDFLAQFLPALDEIGRLRFTKDDISYLRSLGLFKESYLAWLSLCKPYDPLKVTVLNGRITVEGPWYEATLWEIPLLYTFSKCYYRLTEPNYPRQMSYEAEKRVREIDSIGVPWAEFGTRRRFSFGEQDNIIYFAAQAKNFIGTSNPYFAQVYNVPCLGTMAHEWAMAHQVISWPNDWNYYPQHYWKTFYGDKLDCFLPDTLGVDLFFKDPYNFNWQWLRHDSACPLIFVDKALEYWRKEASNHGIIFSDGLNPGKVRRIQDYVAGRCQTRFALGTWLTNHLPKPLSIVCKLTHLDNLPVVKISDEPLKATGDVNRIAEVRKIVASLAF